jgi:hypothetical protein
MALSLFEAFLVTHFIVDWLFQTKWEALNKATRWLPLLVHAVVYTIGFIPAFFYYGVPYAWLSVLFITHVILDRRTFELWWMRAVKRTTDRDVPEGLWWLLLIGVDQVFHIAVLAGIVLLA